MHSDVPPSRIVLLYKATNLAVCTPAATAKVFSRSTPNAGQAVSAINKQILAVQ